ncbi:FOG: Ankyrin repeat [Plasmopara halstedii]|uniref:FOG: Ankyrin repeat n=1 Tax=Plasmopara halstedii TaxID=4781 RepID=A0A0N7L7X3_PLAHL|nr:FOG: Ankyrin repeat [Plasmopara halstedii]CEG48275.1 FOG: Ankyrin repeat [Plasmopara halstedii]|eukprot:XP_024584644.1 FOG: Ankyrin repeat [Plasmopara halstedii]
MSLSENHGKSYKSVKAAQSVPGSKYINDYDAKCDGDADDVPEDEKGESNEIVVRPEPLMQQFASSCDVEAGLQFIDLCHEGNLDAVTQRVHAGSPAGFISKSGWTPVAAAAYSGCNEVLLYLLNLGADTMYETSASARKHHLLDEHTSDSKQTIGNTPLHWACYKGHVDTVAILLAAGYNVEAADSVGNRCLHLACSGGHQEVVAQLLAHSAAVEPRNKFKNRPLDLASEPGCRRLLTQFQAQTACAWCKETFSRLRRPSLCQHCHGVFCDENPCTSTSLPSSQSSLATNVVDCAELDFSTVLRTQAYKARYCQDCTVEKEKAEQDLRDVLDSKRKLISRAIAVLDPTVDNVGLEPAAETGASNVDIEKNEQGFGVIESEVSNQGKLKPDMVSEVDASETLHKNESDIAPLYAMETKSSSENSHVIDNVFDAEQRLTRPLVSLKRRSLTRLPSTDTILNALTVNKIDAESLYTALEIAELRGADSELLCVSQRTYRQLIAQIALQDEVKALLAIRPLGVRSLLKPLKGALANAIYEHVHPVMQSMVIHVIQSAEAECTLFRSHALCSKIKQGSRRHSKNIAILEASLGEAQRRGGSDKLLTISGALRDRLLAEVRLEASLLPFQAIELSPDQTGDWSPLPSTSAPPLRACRHHYWMKLSNC